MQITAGQDSSIRRAGNIQGWLLVATMWLASAGAVLIAPVLPFMEKSFSDVPNAKVQAAVKTAASAIARHLAPLPRPSAA